MYFNEDRVREIAREEIEAWWRSRNRTALRILPDGTLEPVDLSDWVAGRDTPIWAAENQANSETGITDINVDRQGSPVGDGLPEVGH